MTKYYSKGKCSEFIEKINQLSTGERAKLKRSCGKLTYDGGDGFRVFLKVGAQAGDVLNKGCEEQFYCVAALSCLWQYDEKEQDKKLTSFEQCLRNIYLSEEQSKEGLEKKIFSLMDCNWQQNPGIANTKLTRLVKMVKQKGYNVDFAKLLYDMCSWDRDTNYNNKRQTKYVQRRWAETIFTANEKKDEQTNN